MQNSSRAVTCNLGNVALSARESPFFPFFAHLVLDSPKTKTNRYSYLHPTNNLGTHSLTHSLSLLWWDLLLALIYLRSHFVLVCHSFPLLGKQVLAMSHVRRRPDLWSYISFSRPASRSESPTLPLNRADEFDPFEKAGRRYPSPFVADAEGHYNDSKPAWRSPGSRSRIVKIGVAITLILLIAYVLIPGEKARTEKTITGMYCLLACLP